MPIVDSVTSFLIVSKSFTTFSLPEVKVRESKSSSIDIFVVECLMKNTVFNCIVRDILQSSGEFAWLSMACCSWWFVDGYWRCIELLLTKSGVDVLPQGHYTRSMLCYASNLLLEYSRE